MQDPEQLRQTALWLQGKGGYWGTFLCIEPLMGWLNHNGFCVYCNAYLIDGSHMTGGLATTDHLLPKENYPALDFTNGALPFRDYLNAVPACVGCNCLKRSWDPNTYGPELYHSGTDSRLTCEMQKELIRRARTHIESKRAKRMSINDQEQTNWETALNQLGVLIDKPDVQTSSDILTFDPLPAWPQLRRMSPFIDHYIKMVESNPAQAEKNPQKYAHALYEAQTRYDLASNLLAHAMTAQELTAEQIRNLTEKLAGFRNRLELLRHDQEPESVSSDPAPGPSNAALLCELLSSALLQEELELSDITETAIHNPAEWFLTSVAHAPELAIAYLVRKEALRQGVAIESEYSYIDLCLLREGAYTASLEIKGPWGIWRTDTEKLRNDVEKVLAQSKPDVAAAERYNGWILITENETQQREVEQFVRATIAGIAELGRCVVSDPIPINRNGGAVQIHYGHRYESIWVVVFNAVITGLSETVSLPQSPL
jgi:hypothetical protein